MECLAGEPASASVLSMFHYSSVVSDSPVKLMVTLAVCSSVWICKQDLEGSGHGFITHTCAAAFITSWLCPFVRLLPSCPLPASVIFHFQVRAMTRVLVSRTVFFLLVRHQLQLEVCPSLRCDLLGGYTTHSGGSVVRCWPPQPPPAYHSKLSDSVLRKSENSCPNQPHTLTRTCCVGGVSQLPLLCLHFLSKPAL